MPELELENISEANDAAEEQPKTEESGSNHPRSESRAFKQEILSRLSILVASKWEATETLNIYRDVQGILDLDADAFLKPLEDIAEKHHE
jgi:hypothetical protein